MLKTLLFRYITIIILSLNSLSVFAQLFNDAQNPLSVKWRVLKANGIRLIYPAELGAEAQRMGATLKKIYPLVGAGLGRERTSFPILFQNRGTAANGFVQMAPKKSEFYTTPPQNFDSQDWLNNLAIHELRHMAQFDNLTGGRRNPFPQEIYFAYMGAAIPTWFFEGDAVVTETALTHAGRGRQPAWIMPYRTQLLASKKISYEAAYFGSDNALSVGYYQLGYLITSNIRKNHGRNIFDTLLTDIRKRPFRLYPFSASLKKLTGKNSKEWFIATQKEIAERWAIQQANTPFKTYPLLNRVSPTETNYYYPLRISNGLILSLKQGKASTAAFVLTNHAKQDKTLLPIGYQEQPWFTYANGTVCWDEIRSDPRYHQQNYSVICLYNLSTGKYKQLTHTSRLFSPTLSPDGKRIAAVNIDLSNKVTLVELDAATGNRLKTYPNKDNDLIQHPAYNSDGTKLVYVAVNENGKSLHTINSNGIEQNIIPASQQQFSRPAFYRDNIVFNAQYNGLDNIYSIDPAIGLASLKALTQTGTGAFNGSVDNGMLLFNNFTVGGYSISETPLEPHFPGSNNFVNFNLPAARQENTGNVFEAIPADTLPSKKYPALTGLLNIHSISPDLDADNNIGLKIKSNNLLNTMEAYAGLYFQRGLDGALQYDAGFNFKALYPVLSMRYINKERQGYYFDGMQHIKVLWREGKYTFGANIPLTFSSLNHNFGINMQVATSLTRRNTTSLAPLIKNINFPMEYGLVLNHYTRTAARDVAPKWAQYLSLYHVHLPFQQNRKGEVYALASNFYFPGLLKNHSFSVGLNFQEVNGVFKGNREIPGVYGYDQINAATPLKNSLLFNYRFPIAFPDLSLGALAYIRNIRGGVFVHYENIAVETHLNAPKTFGLELRSSMHLLRYQSLADAGIRVIFVNSKYNVKPLAEFLFNFNL